MKFEIKRECSYSFSSHVVRNVLVLCHVDAALKFFIAGAIQGSREGTLGADQEYREEIRKIILERYPAAAVICPLKLLLERFAGRSEQARADYERETAGEILNTKAYGPVVAEIRAAFVELTELAAQADVLVAYLPNHEASMGTAMEMWSAFSHGKAVISITPMTRNLSVVSTSDVILPSIESFDAFLGAGRLSEILMGKPQQRG
jgi:hypothetical protein